MADMKDRQTVDLDIDTQAAPLLAGPLGPFVDFLARINLGLGGKLFLGFLVGALLLIVMGVLSLVVLNRMTDQVDRILLLQERADRSRQMTFDLTSQSHFRAMALLTLDGTFNARVLQAQQSFSQNLDIVEGISPLENTETYLGIREGNEKLRIQSESVEAIYDTGDVDDALAQHLAFEMPAAQEVENLISDFSAQSVQEAAAGVDDFRSDKRTLTILVWVFSGSSLAFAIAVGFVTSLAVIRPVRRIDGVVSGVAQGDFTRQAQVPNRDELGNLSANVNRMTRRLGNLYSDIQNELQERRRAEQDAKDHAGTLQAVNNELESISYALAHDLWPPIRDIETSSQWLLDNESGPSDADRTQRLQSVSSSAGRIGELVQEMVNMSRVLSLSGPEPVRIDTERVDLTVMVRKICDQISEWDPDRKIDFTIAEGIVVEGDRAHLEEMLEVLLENAWKFTGPHPQARIEFGVSDEDGVPVYFVRDDGVGFDMTQVDRLFVPFERLHPESEFPGAGAGLPTAKRITESHGGRIWAEAEVEKGAIFFFTLG